MASASPMTLNKPETIKEDRRLHNYHRWMSIRKRNFKHIQDQLHRPASQFIMNYAEAQVHQYYKWAYYEVKDIFSLLKKKKKGVGTEFWRGEYIQEVCEELANDSRATRFNNCVCNIQKYWDRLHRRYVPYKEHWGVPKEIQDEMGFGESEPLNPEGEFRPDIDNLIVKGKTAFSCIVEEPVFNIPELLVDEFKEDPLQTNIFPDHCQIVAEMRSPVLGINKIRISPNLYFASDMPEAWYVKFIGVETNLFHEEKLVLENLGPVSLRIQWRRIEPYINKTIPFRHSVNLKPRFYFETEKNTILPGQRICLPIWFKSQIPGKYQESWHLITSPVVSEYTPLVIKLVAVAVDKTIDTPWMKIETNLNEWVRNSAIREVIADLERMIEPVKIEKLPYELYYLEQRKFKLNNPCLYYHVDEVNTLKNLYKTVTQDPTQEWNLSIESLHQEILNSDFSNKEKEEHLELFKNTVTELENPRDTVIYQKKYDAVYVILCETIQQIYDESERYKTLFQITQEPPTIDSLNTTRSFFKIPEDEPRVMKLRLQAGKGKAVTTTKPTGKTIPPAKLEYIKLSQDITGPQEEEDEEEEEEVQEFQNFSEHPVEGEPSSVSYTSESLLNAMKNQLKYAEVFSLVVYALLCRAVDQIASVLDSISYIP